MLIATIIRQTVSLEGFKIESVEENNFTIIARLAPDQRFRPRCGVCKSAGIYRDMRKTRYFRHVPIWGYPVFFAYSPRRVKCSVCGAVRVEHMPWTAGKRRQTAAFYSFIETWPGPDCCLGKKLPGFSTAHGEQLHLLLNSS